MADNRGFTVTDNVIFSKVLKTSVKSHNNIIQKSSTLN